MERIGGIGINSAMISDVPGYAWGIVPALAQSEVSIFHRPQPHAAQGTWRLPSRPDLRGLGRRAVLLGIAIRQRAGVVLDEPPRLFMVP
ncbi:MAG: hypothetical protein IPN76_31800 [Saprospiraceae bacterium]|nr:hypothetical protein [Saprospiraceae bacterium]